MSLANEVWKQRHESRALDSVGELALVPAAHTGALARNNLSEGRKVTTKRVRIFVVNLLHVHLAEVALMVDVFFHRILFFMSESP